MKYKEASDDLIKYFYFSHLLMLLYKVHCFLLWPKPSLVQVWKLKMRNLRFLWLWCVDTPTVLEKLYYGEERGRGEGGILHVEAFILVELERAASVLCYQPFVSLCIYRVSQMLEWEQNNKYVINRVYWFYLRSFDWESWDGRLEEKEGCLS